jgi:predicted RNase H-like nuclease (RuvC/YqgF family)
MNKEMNGDAFVPTREIREYDRKLRESVRQREQLKREMAELEKRRKDIFWDVEYAMFYTGIKYFKYLF